MACLVVRGNVSIVLPRWQAQRVGGEYFSSLLGMLMPASNDAKKDREIFLKVLTMDD